MLHTRQLLSLICCKEVRAILEIRLLYGKYLEEGKEKTKIHKLDRLQRWKIKIESDKRVENQGEKSERSIG